MDVSRGGINRLLHPRSVAIVGASPRPGTLGSAVLTNLQRRNFAGALYLVNPRHTHIFGHPCLSAIEELPAEVEVAVLAVSRKLVVESLEALAKRQVGAVIIFSAGFAEDGEQGKQEQLKIAQIARENDMVVLGPNCLGLVNYVDGIALSFVETSDAVLGATSGIGILSQSGAMAAVLEVTLASRELGVSYAISTGNEAASGIEDYLDYLLDDSHTSAIGLIVEQIRQPQRFLALARRAREMGKSLVLLHPGRSVAARESAVTHTGALVGDYQVMRTLVEQAGVLVVDSLEELGDVLELVVRGPQIQTNGTAVITESGAHKALILDLCESIGLLLPAVTEDDKSWREAVPEFVAVSNPLDLTAQGLVDLDIYGQAIRAALEDVRIGALILAIIQTGPETSGHKFPSIIEALSQSDSSKPVVFVGLDEGAEVSPLFIHQLRQLGVSYFSSSERALRALGRVVNHAFRNFGAADHCDFPEIELPHASGTVPAYLGKALLAPLGISFPAGAIVTHVEEALAVANRIGYPLVLKAQSKELAHKTEAGGVVVGVENDFQLQAAWQQIHKSIENYAPDLQLEGILVEALVTDGIQLIVGGRRDPEWGPVLLVGFGGVEAELRRDVQLLPADLAEAAIMERIIRLQSAPLLQGFRGAPVADLPAVASLIAQMGSLMMREPRMIDIEFNPVAVHESGKGVTVLDVLMQIDSP